MAVSTLQWLGILFTLLVTRERTAKVLLQMLVLACLESAVDEMKMILCERRGIPVHRVRLRLSGNALFVLALILCGTSVAVGSVAGIRADCFFFGHH